MENNSCPYKIEYKEVNSYIKTDDNIIINEKCIKWVKKIDECLLISIKSSPRNNNNTHSICKIYTPYSYNKLNRHFYNF
jgi:hypothetical protein